ncbi:DUF5110 domain-containing protein [Thalassotalea sp. M1531]|uniref:DUF5110 domain-containing protein n=1 Tax=Thalassotalea algicola TaxID=2716224 RepID=A0A7Y0L902_9GAMM|nr:TIM-barrel domain-containing protein [Thalassotalea algicola]NMP30007.1 DUF5110 domain-containing protein [Thalassotalea algicola]
MWFSANKALASIIGLLLFVAFNAVAGYQSHQLHQGKLIVKGTDLSGALQVIELQPYNQTSIATTYRSKHHYQLPSYAIASDARAQGGKVYETPEMLVLDAGELIAKIDKVSLAIQFYRGSDLLLTQHKFIDLANKLQFDFSIDDEEKLLGGGQRVLGMDRRGHKLPLYNKAHYGYTTESRQMYYGLPAIMSSKKYTLIFDNSASGQMDLDSENINKLSFEAVSGRASYIVTVGSSYPNLINNYVNLTGKQPMPPRWALGNFASRFGYHSQQEVMETVAKFEQDDIPLDAIVLDLYWFGKDVKGHMGNLDWDKEAFPNPEQMTAKLASKGVNTVVITEPFILTTSNKWQSAVDGDALALNAENEPYRFDFYFGNTGLVDVFNEQGNNWFGEAYHQLASQGVTGWWGDLGEPEVQPDDILHTLPNGKRVRGDAIHNVYGHKWAEMVYQQSQKFSPNQRPMIMMRSGFVGSQRFGMIPWTGDVSRSWGGLKPQVELSLQMGLLGLAYTHSDLGGFAGGETFDAEMYTRWLQYGAFQPVYRPHAQEAIAPEPVFHDEATKAIVRKFIKLRYKLLPYNYTLAYENSVTGMPLMRPLMFEDETNHALIDEKHSFLWGDAFLVTPVLAPEAQSVSVNVPKGLWFDYWTDQLITGGQHIDYAVNKEIIPVLVRAGSFIPMAAEQANTKQYNGEELTLDYYHHESIVHGEGKLYEDDGISLNSIKEQAFDLLKFNAVYQQNQLTISFHSEGNGYRRSVANREMTLNIRGWKQTPKIVSGDQRDIPILHNERAFSLASEGALWLKGQNILTIKFSLANNTQQLIIEKH